MSLDISLQGLLNNYFSYMKDEDFMRLLFVTKSLMKKFWEKNLLREPCKTILEENYSYIFDFLKIMYSLNKFDIKNINGLIKLMKNKNPNLLESFDLYTSMPSDNRILNYLNEKFNEVKVVSKHNNNLGIKLEWWWYLYDRNLKDDLDKLL